MGYIKPKSEPLDFHLTGTRWYVDPKKMFFLVLVLVLAAYILKIEIINLVCICLLMQLVFR